MTHPYHGPRTMNQKIFELGLSKKTVSLYLLCCGLADIGSEISTKTILPVWNSDEAALEKGLDELGRHNIIQPAFADTSEQQVYELLSEEHWDSPG